MKKIKTFGIVSDIIMLNSEYVFCQDKNGRQRILDYIGIKKVHLEIIREANIDAEIIDKVDN